MNAFKPRLIHIAYINIQQQGKCYLFLRQLDTYRYVWFKENLLGDEIETSIWGATLEEAIHLARRAWRVEFFTSLKCGFRYTLPERDEHGTNALFYQMIASYSSMNGIYFEEELGTNCIVQNASIEARTLWHTLQQANRL